MFYKRTTDSKGVAKMNINLIPNTYVITAKNPKTNEMFTNKITVKPTIVENHDLTKYYKNSSQYTFRILGANGKPVGKGVTVDMNINGVIYKRQTDANGYVKMTINLIPGTYTITASHNGLKASNTIKVLNVLFGKNVAAKFRSYDKYEVKLLNGRGQPYEDQSIKLDVDGMTYYRTTDSNGIARFSVYDFDEGRHIITATYNGLSISNTITIT